MTLEQDIQAVASASLILPSSEAELLKQASGAFLSLTLTPRQICDLELLVNGGFAPLSIQFA